MLPLMIANVGLFHHNITRINDKWWMENRESNMDTAEKSSENRDKMAKRLTPKLAWRLEERKEQESQNAASKQQRFA